MGGIAIIVAIVAAFLAGRHINWKGTMIILNLLLFGKIGFFVETIINNSMEHVLE